MLQTLALNNFSGGMNTTSGKLAPKNSAALIQNLNIHEDPAYITLAPQPTLISGNVVTDFVGSITPQNSFDTNLYAYGSTGNIYKIDQNNNVTLDHKVSNFASDTGSEANGMYVFNNFLYYATATTMGRKGLLSAGGSYADDYFTTTSSKFWLQDPALFGSGTGQTYTLLNGGISQTAANRIQFIADREPLLEIDFKIAATGTTSWNLALIDATDSGSNVLHFVTVSHAQLVATGVGNYQPFVFTDTPRLTLGNTYYLHLYDTSGDGQVTTGVASDFSTVNYQGYFQTLINTPHHPMANLGGLVFGNEHYIGQWTEGKYNPNAVAIDAGYSVRTLHREDIYIVATAYQGTDITKAQSGKLYYWDGIQSGFNYSYEIADGAVFAAANFKNRTITILGNKGSLYMGTNPFQKVYTLNNVLARNQTVPVDAPSITTWKQRLFIGYGNPASDPNFPTGVWGFGNSSEQFPEVLTRDFTISTGNMNQNVVIGGLSGAGANLYIGWEDTNASRNGEPFTGIDMVSEANTPQSSGKWMSLILDGGNPQKSKLWLTFVVSFVALNPGESVQPFYSLDRNPTLTFGQTVTATGSTRAELAINARAKELQVGFILASVG